MPGAKLIMQGKILPSSFLSFLFKQNKVMPVQKALLYPIAGFNVSASTTLLYALNKPILYRVLDESSLLNLF